jgi:hypothetical protein
VARDGAPHQLSNLVIGHADVAAHRPSSTST